MSRWVVPAVVLINAPTREVAIELVKDALSELEFPEILVQAGPDRVMTYTGPERDSK